MGLEQFITTGVFAFMLVFTRIGTAATIMPGIGDSYVNMRLRLLISLGFSLVMFPIIMPMVPMPVPGPIMLTVLLVSEFIIGLMIGTVGRILMTALDTAGMIVSISSGLGNAQIFNPAFATQGSLMGAFMSISGVMMLFASNLHHILFYGLAGSYEMFPLGEMPDTGSMAELIVKYVSSAFAVGVEIAAPFLVVSTVMYIGMGVLSRLMPQLQVFMLAMPLQIIVSLITLGLAVSAMFLFWLTEFRDGMAFFLNSAG